jgi:hypothetical protein
MINQPAQHPLFRHGLETSPAAGVMVFPTGLLRTVEDLHISFKDSAGKDEAKYDWDDLGNGDVQVTILKADGSAADTAVTFSWTAFGF